MKFLITTKYSPVEYMGNAIIHTTGKPPFINTVDELIGELVDDNKIQFRTGMDIDNIKTNAKLEGEEREIFAKKAKPIIQKVKEKYPTSVNASNRAFWNQQRIRLRINSLNISNILDTENVEDAIIYLNILAGGFATISPSKEVAERTGDKFYITTEEEDTRRETEDNYGTKLEAFAALNELLNEAGNDALVYISYLTSDMNKGFTRNTSRETIKKSFMDYIEGKQSPKEKKKSADNFYKLAQEWKLDKEGLIGKAIISAAVFSGIIKKSREKKLDYKGLELGLTVQSAYDTLMRPTNINDFGELTEDVEKFLNK